MDEICVSMYKEDQFGDILDGVCCIRGAHKILVVSVRITMMAQVTMERKRLCYLRLDLI
jgi:hypothetical protein